MPIIKKGKTLTASVFVTFLTVQIQKIHDSGTYQIQSGESIKMINVQVDESINWTGSKFTHYLLL